jgi:signal transduction histidine kinase
MKRNYTLPARLTRMNLIVSGAVLLMAALAFFSYDLISFRRDLIRSLESEAQIVGENSVSALLFNDEVSAANTLRGLHNAPDVLSATLVSPDGTAFAHYGAEAQEQWKSHPLASGETDRVWTSATDVLLAHRIVFQHQTVGAVYITARLREIRERARRYLLIAGIIWLFCMGAAVLISSFSRRLIAKPITALADTAMRVSRDRDYSIRADVSADSNEIAVLIDAFNTMLGQIQERDAAINQARNELETRVEERTAALRAVNRELEAFSYTVAHDLRNPLSAISAISFFLSKYAGSSDDPNIKTVSDNLQTTVSNMSALIDNLLNFARASSTPVNSISVELSALAREVCAELTTANPDRQVDFVIHDVPSISADPGLMRIVMNNLMGNAWKYTSHHDRARIEFGFESMHTGENGHGQLTFFVRDDGAGFDPVRLNQLFQPFQRLHAKSEFPGTGIGLATVQRILARHGGTIWAEGAVEKGATFHFTLNGGLASSEPDQDRG